MFGFPASTEFNKRIPKQKFYENIKIPPSVKRSFVDQVHLICWRNKLSTTTLNIGPGENVTEIEVLEVTINSLPIDEAILRLIDRKIPYHTLIILTYQELAQAWIAYKEIPSGQNRSLKSSQYFHTTWMPKDDLSFTLNGINIDLIYKHLLKKIAGKNLSIHQNETIKESIIRAEHERSIQNKVNLLKIKLQNEKQFNRRIEISNELKKTLKMLTNYPSYNSPKETQTSKH